MGFDNECIVNIQSLPGEYFCPVCRTLVYPNDSLQAQCTHLYCKPCLAYVVATTHACPYDGYLVTEADAKPLVESNKELSETISKVAVHCLYHRSGCTWQGTLAECTTHCAGCSYGNSPVVCNRCGTQIVHSQVQEHAQICPGVQPQTQAESGQPQAAAQDPTAAASAAATSTATAAASAAGATTAAAPAATAAAATPSAATAAPGQTQVQGGAVGYPQAPSAEQWYQQQQLQYQQYYQQYPGYDPYQQQYQQYAQYQQQGQTQYMQPQLQAAGQQVAPGQQQPQPYMHPQPQPQAHSQPQPHAQPQHQVAQSHPQQQQLPPQPQLRPPHMPAQIPPMQAQPHVPAQQPQAQPPHGQIPGQPHPQPHQLHPMSQPQARPPQLPGPPQHQQPVPPQQHPPAHMPYPQPHPQQQLRPQHPPGPPPTQPLPMQPHPQPHLQTIPPTQASHPPSHAVSGYHSYGAAQPRPNQMQPQQAGMPPQYQHTPQMQGQFPPNQPAQMRPPHAQMPVQVQQQPAMAAPHLPPANLHPGQQQVHQPMPQTGMQQHAPQHGFPHAQAQGHLHPGQMQQQGAVPFQQQMYAQQPFRPQGPPHMQQQVQARPMVPNQGMPQQPFQQPPGGGSNVVQPGQSPKQAYPARSASQVPKSSELQQSQVPQSGEQGSMVHVSPATSKQDRSGQVIQLEVGMTSKAVEGAKSTENLPDHVSDTNSDGKEDKLNMGTKDKPAQAESGSKEHSESKQSGEALANEENVDGKIGDQVNVKEEEVNEEIQGHDRRPDEKSGAQVQGEIAHAGADKVVQAPPQMPASGGFVRGQPVQPSNQSALPSEERGIPQSGFPERNATQFPQQYPPARPPFPNQERFPPQQGPYGPPPSMSGPAMVSQRPAAPDRMFPQPMSQENRFPEPPPHPMQVPGQGMPPAQMRPPAPGHTPVAPEPFWPPPQAGGPGLGLPPPPAGAPFHHGFRPNSFEQQSMPPPGQLQTHMPPPHAGGARAAPGEPLTRPTMVGPPPGALDTPSRMMGGAIGQSPHVTPMEAEAYALKRPGVYDGRHPETLRHLPTEHAPYGQQSALNINGMPNKAYDGGMHDPAFGPSLGEDRYRRLPEEGFNAPQDRFRPTLDPGRHTNKREFEEDLKQFPRPAYLDEGPKYDGYMSSSRPSDKTPHVSGGSRPLPSYQSGAPFPPSSAGSAIHLDVGERDRPGFLHDHMGRKHDTVADHPNPASEFGRHRLDGMPPLRSPGREYDGFSSTKFGPRGQPRRDDFDERDQHGPPFKPFNFPPPGPGYFSRDVPDGPGGLRADQLRRGLDGPDIPNIHPHAGAAPGHGFGVSRNYPGVGEHGRPGFPSHMHFGDSGGFNGHFGSISREGEFDGFESRKRKPGSMGWCRICKIDCETVEGLDLHAQTREHQKMTMDLVLSIKQDNARKHKLTSENAMPFEDPNRSRKSKIENRGKRQ